MGSLLVWIAYGLGAVLFVACVVAWYEHLGRTTRRPHDTDWEAEMPPPRSARRVDVELDLDPTAADPGHPVNEQGLRRQALGGALARMSEGAARARFCDTTPMILPSRPADTAPPERRRMRDAETSR